MLDVWLQQWTRIGLDHGFPIKVAHIIGDNPQKSIFLCTSLFFSISYMTYVSRGCWVNAWVGTYMRSYVIKKKKQMTYAGLHDFERKK